MHGPSCSTSLAGCPRALRRAPVLPPSAASAGERVWWTAVPRWCRAA